MPRIVLSTTIARPIADVFDYATELANWPDWRPASRSVSGAVDDPLNVGERAEEEFVAAGRVGNCPWLVTRHVFPRLWSIASTTPQARIEITYRLKEKGGSTIFERELTYTRLSFWLKVVDFLFLRKRLVAESRKALEGLKARLEAPRGKL
jgi:hypothetical protein